MMDGIRIALLAASTSVLAYPFAAHAEEKMLAAAGTLAATPAGATGSGVLQEIVVTARKRSESLINVPVSTAAISGDSLARAAINNLTYFGEMVSQVSLTPGRGSGGSFSIRGLGSSFVDAGVEQTVSIAIDGVQVGRGNIITQSFFDIQQVEVLKGPQALFFGKNSPAGVVSIQSRDPSDQFEGYVRSGFEFNADERYVEGAVSMPVTNTLSVRIAGRINEMNGYFVNNARGGGPWLYAPQFVQPDIQHSRQPNSRAYTGRLTAEWKPSDDFTAKLKFFGSNYQDDSANGTNQFLCKAPQSNVLIIPAAGIVDPYAKCGPPRGQLSFGVVPAEVATTVPGLRDGRPYQEADLTLASLNLGYSRGGLTYSSISSWLHINNRSSAGAGPTSQAIYPAYLYELNDTYTQEFRATSDFDFPLNFTAGAYYDAANFDTGTNQILFPTAIDPVAGTYSNANSVERNRNRTYSVFGQARWNIRDNVELAAGARWTHETKRGALFNSYVNPQPAFFGPSPSMLNLPQGQVLTPSISARNVSPEVTLSWHPVHDTTLYAAFKTGYKSGGISNPIILTGGFTSENLTFKNEKAKGGEIGAKGFLFDRRVRLGGTLYLYDYTNLQVSSFNPATFGFLVQNAAAARVKGIEVDADWLVTRDLTLTASVGRNDAIYRSFPNAPCGALPESVDPACTRDITGQPLAHAPKWSGTVGSTFDTPVASDINLGLHVDVNFSSRFSTEPDAAYFQPGYAKLNASVRIHSQDDKWDLAFIGRNLTNKYILSWTSPGAFGGVNQVEAGVQRPRELILEGTVRF